MRGGLTHTGVFHARRVHATDAGGGCPFRTSDPLLEPEDGPLHLRRTQPNPHHQPREDAADVRGGANFVKGVIADGGTVLFVGTKRSARESIQKEAERAAQPFVNQRWLGGMLTNFKTIRQSIKRLAEITELRRLRRAGEARQEGSDRSCAARWTSSKEASAASRTWSRCPDALFVVDVGHENIAHPRGQEARHPGGRRSSTPTAPRTASTT